jgi:hypothetical protein
MNHHALEEKSGVLKITPRGNPKLKLAEINVYFHEGKWDYIRNNGQKIALNDEKCPEEMIRTIKIGFGLLRSQKVDVTYNNSYSQSKKN